MNFWHDIEDVFYDDYADHYAHVLTHIRYYYDDPNMCKLYEDSHGTGIRAQCRAICIYVLLSNCFWALWSNTNPLQDKNCVCYTAACKTIDSPFFVFQRYAQRFSKPLKAVEPLSIIFASRNSGFKCYSCILNYVLMQGKALILKFSASYLMK